VAAQHTVEPDPAGDQHRLHVVGYVHASRSARRLREHSVRVELPGFTRCDSPLLWGCEHGCCLAVRACGNRRESRCTPCATRYRRRVTRIAESGLLDPSRQAVGHQYLTTINAPGDAGHRRWHPGRRGRHELCSCSDARSSGDAAWNASAGKRWNHYVTALRRLHPSIQFFRAAEVQERGLLHQHHLMHSLTAVTAEDVQAAALAAGYGCVMDHQHVTSPQQTARYLAKYVGKSTDQRPSVPWERLIIDETTGEVLEVRTRPTYRSYSQSRLWGLTMRECIAAASRSAALARLRSENPQSLSPAELLADMQAQHGSSPPLDRPG
jgi:hypothetical protein